MTCCSGHHLGHAKVTLDGHATRFTDANGRVRFSGVRDGRHAIRITAEDQKALTAVVSLHPGQRRLLSYQLGGGGMSMTPLLWTVLIASIALLTAAASACWGVIARRRRGGSHRAATLRTP